MPSPPRIVTWALAFIITITIISGAIAEGPRDPHHQGIHQDLGVASVQLFAKAPVLLKEKVLLLNIWLKRVTWDSSSGEPQGGQPGLHGFAWAEDLDALNRNQEGHMLMGVDQNVWQPRLRLETARGTVVQAQPATDLAHEPNAKSSLRPFHFMFPLEPNHPSRCFKMYEESFPGYRASFCVPLMSQRLCRRLASFNSSEGPAAQQVPALWSLVFPPRSTGVNGSHWEYHARLIANRVFNYAVYQIGIGGAGVLVYADRMMRAGLERMPRIYTLMARGRLIMVTWDMPERSPMTYKYDQALVASHALLGLSACTDVLLLLADMDEYLYSAFGNGWPSIHACMTRADPRATLHRIQRIDAASSRLDPSREGSWWVLPARSLARHPIMAYDKLKREAMRPELSKVLAAPAARVVGFYVHDGFPMYGTSQLVNADCAFLLHIPNYWGPRAAVAAASGSGGGGAAVTAAEDSAAAATIAAAAAAGGTVKVGDLDTLESVFSAGGFVDGSCCIGGLGTSTADGSSTGAKEAAAPASTVDYAPFKVSSTWVVGLSNTGPLNFGSGMRAGRAGGGGGGVSRMRGGEAIWRFGDDGGADGGGGAGGTGVLFPLTGESAAAAAAAAVAAAAANTAAAAAAVATGASGDGGTSVGVLLDDGSLAVGANVAAAADRLAALAAEKAKQRRMAEEEVARKAVEANAAAQAVAGGEGQDGSVGGRQLRAAEVLAERGAATGNRENTAIATTRAAVADGDDAAVVVREDLPTGGRAR